MLDSLIPGFDEEPEIDDNEVIKWARRIIVYPFLCEFQVLKGILVEIVSTCSFCVSYVLSFFNKFQDKSKKKYVQHVFYSILLDIFIIIMFNLTIGSATHFIARQTIYKKIWGIYTICLIVGRFMLKINKFSHRVLRVAIRNGTGTFFSVIIASLSNLIGYLHNIIIMGTLISPLYGRTKIFLSSCLHIQFIRLKKFLPKVGTHSLLYTESLNRIIALTLVFYKSISSKLDKTIEILFWEYVFAFVNFLFVGLSTDNAEFLNNLKQEADSGLTEIFGRSKRNIEDSLFVVVPHETLLLTIFVIIYESKPWLGKIVMCSFLLICLICYFFILKKSPAKGDVSSEKKDD